MSVGGMIAVTYLPALLFAPWAGVWADHRDAKWLAVWTDVGRALVVLAMAAMVAAGAFSLPAFYALQLVLAFGNVLFKPASQALVKEAFIDDDLVEVLTKGNSIALTMTIIGTGVGGLLAAAFPPAVFLLVNAVTFVLSAGCNKSLKRITRRRIINQEKPFWEELAKGWTFIRKTHGMLYLLGLSVVSSWSLQMNNTLLSALVYGQLHGGKALFASMDIVFTVGGALSGLFIKKALAKWGPWTAVGTMVGMGSCSLFLIDPKSVPLVGILLFGLGFFTMFHLVLMQTLIQVNTPKELIGRVIGLRQILASMIKISSALVSGALVEAAGLSWVYGGFGCVVALVLLTSRRVQGIPIPESMRQGTKSRTGSRHVG